MPIDPGPPSPHDLAARLHVADATATPIAAPEAPLGLSGAYAAQIAGAQMRGPSDPRTGFKVALTGHLPRQVLGADEPTFGHLHAGMEIISGATVPLADFIAPRVEPELAFLVGDDPPSDLAHHAFGAVSAVAVAIEIADCRFVDWSLTLDRHVADNASGARYVLGPWQPLSRAGADLPRLNLDLAVDNETCAGTGAAVDGDPRLSVPWLAGALARHGLQLRRGDIVLAGAFTRAVAVVRAGTSVRVSCAELGAASVTFS